MWIEHHVILWQRGKTLSEDVEVSESEAGQVMQKASALYPWAVQNSAEEFESKWSADRGSCEKESDQRRSKAASVI